MSKLASYLTQRNGIFYFQARIPAQYRHEHPGKKYFLIRRSTRTGDRRAAINIARKWIVELMETNFTRHKAAPLTVDQIERLLDEETRLYRLGAERTRQLDGIHADDHILRNLITDDWGPGDWKALEFYEKYREKFQEADEGPIVVQKPDIPAPAPLSNTLRIAEVVDAYLSEPNST